MAQKNRQLAAKNDRARRERAAFMVDATMREDCRPAHAEICTITSRHVAMRGTVKTATIRATQRPPILATHW